MSFPAKYPGRCAACGERFEAGDEIAMVDDQPVHVECEDVPAAPAREVVVCEECWLVKPCECDDEGAPAPDRKERP